MRAQLCEVRRVERRLARQWRWRQSRAKDDSGAAVCSSSSSPSVPFPLSDCLPSLCCCLHCMRTRGRRRRRKRAGSGEEEGEAEEQARAAALDEEQEASEQEEDAGVEEDEEGEDPFTDRVGGLPSLPCPPPQPSSSSAAPPYHCPPLVRWPLCGACRSVMALVCQMQTPTMQGEEEEGDNSDGRLYRLLAVFACPQERCWEHGGGEGEQDGDGWSDRVEEEDRLRVQPQSSEADDGETGDADEEAPSAWTAAPNARPSRRRSPPFSRARCTTPTRPAPASVAQLHRSALTLAALCCAVFFFLSTAAL